MERSLVFDFLVLSPVEPVDLSLLPKLMVNNTLVVSTALWLRPCRSSTQTGPTIHSSGEVFLDEEKDLGESL